VETPESTAAKAAYARLFSATSTSHDGVGGLFAHFGAALVERAELSRGDRVLDVGCGTGASLLPASRRVGPVGWVVGIDLAPGMVDESRAAIEKAAIVNAEATLADAEELPFADGSFDAVLCGFALFFFPHPERALDEAYRVLRPGGRIALSTFTREGSASIDDIWRRIADHMPVPPTAPDGSRFHDAERVLGALAEAGFSEGETVVSPFEVVLPDLDAWMAWLRSMEFGEYLAQMDQTTHERFTSAASAEFAAQPGAPAIRFRMDALLARARKPVVTGIEDPAG
jgi:ubiquinone/menaquinone biosynthesis C-methylase UbiE